MSKILQVPAQFTKASRKTDGSVTLTFVTEGEVSNEQYAFIDSFWKENGFLLFRKNEFTEAEIPTNNTSGGKMTPSQELRRSLYAKWKALHPLAPSDDFKDYYTQVLAGFKKAVDDSHPDND